MTFNIGQKYINVMMILFHPPAKKVKQISVKISLDKVLVNMLSRKRGRIPINHETKYKKYVHKNMMARKMG